MTRSLAVIREHQASSGAYPASPSFSAYRGYAWLRDGSFIAEAMSRHEDLAGAAAFHAWCDRVIGGRADQVDVLIDRKSRGERLRPAQMLPTRFTLAGADGTDEWWDYQLDGYGTWLWALGEHVRRHGAPVPDVAAGVQVAARYLIAFWREPCYDWWEEHATHRHVSTLGAIHAGLRSAASLDVLGPNLTEAAAGVVDAIEADIGAGGIFDGHLTKWLGSDALDASLLACIHPFGLYPVDHPVAVATVAAVEEHLAWEGGVYRYLADTFYGGGRWPLLSGLLGWNHAQAGRRADAMRYLEWIADQAAVDGYLPEQVSTRLLAPGRYAEWLRRWGQVATPLLWSHGMYLILADELGVRS